MKIAIVVFAYNRPEHLSKVLDGLKSNKVVEEIYIFQDGLKYEYDRNKWINTRNIIENIDWCKVHKYYFIQNKGLSEAILFGLSVVFRENDAAIVLEDDCVPTSNFIDFMYQCLNKYVDKKNVYNISGYSWPIDIKNSEYDAYFCGRTCSWGWATWKERWEQYRQDYTITIKAKKEKELSKNLQLWGNDLQDMLIGNIKGYCDSWAVFWSLVVIQNKGLCINPYKSLINNIGLDNSGRHCGKSNRFDVDVDSSNKKNFSLPNEICILEETQIAYRNWNGSMAVDLEIDKRKKEIIVYGIGQFYHEHERELCKEFIIRAYIDKKLSGWYAGKPVASMDILNRVEYDFIIIMVKDLKECNLIVKRMINANINSNKIIIGRDKFI